VLMKGVNGAVGASDATLRIQVQPVRGVFEVRQRFSDPRVKIHEGCGGPVQRLLSPSRSGKGSGFYATDYAKGSKGGKGSKKKEEAPRP